MIAKLNIASNKAVFRKLYCVGARLVLITSGTRTETAIDCILVAQILSNLQSFTKVGKSGTLSQYQLLLHRVFSPLRKKCWSFYL